MKKQKTGHVCATCGAKATLQLKINMRRSGQRGVLTASKWYCKDHVAAGIQEASDLSTQASQLPGVDHG